MVLHWMIEWSTAVPAAQDQYIRIAEASITQAYTSLVRDKGSINYVTLKMGFPQQIAK